MISAHSAENSAFNADFFHVFPNTFITTQNVAEIGFISSATLNNG